MAKISKLSARQILDSRGFPTVEATVFLNNRLSASASVPSGMSTGSHEALELRDNDSNIYFGKSVYKAVSVIKEKLSGLLRDVNIEDQKEIDQKMIAADGSDNKKNFGANSILAVSLAAARCASIYRGLPLYKYLRNLYGKSGSRKPVIPLFNVINGGLHADNSVRFQEFFLIPKKNKFAENLELGCVMYWKLKKKLRLMAKNTTVGDEGGFAPRFEKNEAVLNLLKELTRGHEVALGLDVAAGSFYRNGQYLPEKEALQPAEYLNFIARLCQAYHLEVLEDGLFEDAWDDWTTLTRLIGSKTRVIGDDLLVTNPNRLKKAVGSAACNGILIKLNQIGTLTETLNVISMAREAKFSVVISHRSGETTDDFIADLAVGVAADYVKFGAPVRGERVVKYNRLLEIYQNSSFRTK